MPDVGFTLIQSPDGIDFFVKDEIDHWHGGATHDTARCSTALVHNSSAQPALTVTDSESGTIAHGSLIIGDAERIWFRKEVCVDDTVKMFDCCIHAWRRSRCSSRSVQVSRVKRCRNAPRRCLINLGIASLPSKASNSALLARQVAKTVGTERRNIELRVTLLLSYLSILASRSVLSNCRVKMAGVGRGGSGPGGGRGTGQRGCAGFMAKPP